MGNVYENSPCYIGTTIWETPPDAVQESDNVLVFKNEISKLYKTYKKFCISYPCIVHSGWIFS